MSNELDVIVLHENQRLNINQRKIHALTKSMNKLKQENKINKQKVERLNLTELQSKVEIKMHRRRALLQNITKNDKLMNLLKKKNEIYKKTIDKLIPELSTLELQLYDKHQEYTILSNKITENKKVIKLFEGEIKKLNENFGKVPQTPTNSPTRVSSPKSSSSKRLNSPKITRPITPRARPTPFNRSKSPKKTNALQNKTKKFLLLAKKSVPQLMPIKPMPIITNFPIKVSSPKSSSSKRSNSPKITRPITPRARPTPFNRSESPETKKSVPEKMPRKPQPKYSTV